MSRSFLTNINLNKNELQNAAIQSLQQAPQNPVTGQIYFDTVAGTLRQFNGSIWLNYVSAENGTEFIQSADSNFSVVNGQLSLATDVGITGNFTGSNAYLNYVTVRDGSNNPEITIDGVARKIYFANGTTQTGTIETNTNDLVVVAANRDLKLTSTNGDVALSAHGKVTSTSNISAPAFETTSGFIVGPALANGSGLTLSTWQDVSAINIQNDGNVIIYPYTGKAYVGGTAAGQEIATKSYVDGVAQGLNVKESVLAATFGNIDIANINNYAIAGGLNLGTGNSVTIDGSARILFKDQTDPTENGIYVVTNTGGTWSAARAVDQQIPEKGDYVFVEGSKYAAQGYIVTVAGVGGYTWTQFSAAGEYLAGTAIDLTGNTIAVKTSNTVFYDGMVGGLTVSTDGLGIGLNGSGAVEVRLGDGLAANTTGLHLDTANGYGVRKYSASNGALLNTAGLVHWEVTHNLGTRDVTVQLFDLSTYEQIEVDVVRTSTSVVTLSWVSGDVSADAYRVVVVG